MSWSRLFPFLNWPRATAATLRKDAVAGLSVALVLIPQSLAYATLAGMPPETGLYAALLPALFGILWGSSSILAVGPVALTSLLTFASLKPFAVPGSAEWAAFAVWLAIYSGAIQLALGGLRLGAIANFVSYPVVAGFVNAAALIIVMSQLPALLGIPGGFDAALPTRAQMVLGGTPGIVAQTATIGITALMILIVMKRRFPRVPGVLLVSLAAIAVSVVIGYADRGGEVVGAIPRGLPSLGNLPALSLDQHVALLPAAVIVALISFTEAMSSCRALSRTRGEQWNENQELIGQGLAKIAAGASGAFPVSGSFSRSALNAYVGATSGYSTLFSTAAVATFLLWGTACLYHLPRAVLAAIIIVPVLGLVNWRVFGRLWRTSRDDGAIALLTFAVTLAAVPYLHWGVAGGFAASLLCYLLRRARPRIVEVGVHADGSLRDRAVFHLPPLAPDVLAVRMDAGITYITASVLERFVTERVCICPGLRTVLLCCSAVNDIDATGVETLSSLHRSLAAQGIAFRLCAVKKQVREVLDRTGLHFEFGEAAFFSTDLAAIESLARRDAVARAAAGV